jgi:uncharacterized membrane protein YcaP (DUF421 family)
VGQYPIARAAPAGQVENGGPSVERNLRSGSSLPADEYHFEQNAPAMETMRDLLGLGLEPRQLGVFQVCFRGVIVFVVALIIVRVANKRFMSRMTAFDAVLGFILASVLARAINGSAPFGPTLAVGFVLVLLHRLFSTLAFYSETLGSWIKGHSSVLVQDGKRDRRAMRAHKISNNDLLEAARMNGQVTELEKIRLATLERSGKISIVPSDS